MNSKKVFLTAAAGLFAIAAVFATKANTKRIVRYYQTPTQCLNVTDPCPATSGAVQCKFSPDGTNTYDVFTTKISNSLCQTPLTYRP